jgi:hypothetical protein
MTVSGDYEKILQDNFKEELEWLEEEFELLFKNKKEKSKDDIILGNQIIDQIIDNFKTNNSEELLNLLTITLNKLERNFPEFF